jgi:hypothetical protein
MFIVQIYSFGVLTQLDFPFYDFAVIYYDFSKLL